MSAPLNSPSIAKLQRLALIVGAVFFVILVVGLLINKDHFFQSYLIGFTFWTGIAVGSLALLMLQHMTGGGWGFVIRRVLESSTRTLPLMALLFVPVILGAHSLYPWTHEEELAHHEVVRFKTPYLNLPFFTIRTIIYFAIWLALMFFLNRWSLGQDRTGDNWYTKSMKMISGPGMVLLIFSVTFASVDWYMSLEPEWFSTIYGFIFVASWGLSALAFTIAVMANLSKEEPLKHVVATLHFHDLGKLLLALVMLWAYFAFSQYLIIWSGNLPEEIGYYLDRTYGVWGAIVLSVVILHFAFPFLFLLSRDLKRDPQKLVLVACLILVMRAVDLLWVLKPAFPHPSLKFIWMDLAALIGFGGLWLAMFSWQLGKRNLVPINDPQYESVLEQAHEGGH
jgi:hypothetical protein